MASKCFMCGREISSGILCDKCDRPKKTKAETAKTVAIPAFRPDVAPITPPPPSPPKQSAAPPPKAAAPAAAPAAAVDPFPKAPVVPFPVESASPAITSVVNVLVASGVACVLVGPDRSVKFVSDETKRLFDAPQSDLMNLRFIEAHTGLRIGELSVPTSGGLRIRNRNVLHSLVPLSGGASGAVLLFRPADGFTEAHASFANYVRETVFGPLRALRESLAANARSRGRDALLEDAAATIEQIVSSLELAPGVEEPGVRPVPTVTEIVQRVADRFVPYADLKNIQLQVDAQELAERFADHDQLTDALGILMDNALHYVAAGGQVVIGVRWMEHKGKPLLLFFVMDNGLMVPEHLRQAIFEPGFVWQPSSNERSGRGLFKCREFAVAHAGSVWVESKTGKACTFFMRIRPDSAR
jgi:signal transduction histidine kinase